jgi:hypothetical protein
LFQICPICPWPWELLQLHLDEYYTDVLPNAGVDWGGTTPILGQLEEPPVDVDPHTGKVARTIKQFLREVQDKRSETIRGAQAHERNQERRLMSMCVPITRTIVNF